mmetsp:Transcript_70555/g.178633  ORF Transcript_70555/g.178633 Transcript_70555/m.178633 type:complete len:356 (+) Transcript_70555:2931-3998(+)
MRAVLPRTSPLFMLGLHEDDENHPSLPSATFRKASVSPKTAASSMLLIFTYLGMNTTPSRPRLRSEGSPTTGAPSAPTRDIQPVTIGADIRTRYRSIGLRSVTDTTVPGLILALTSLLTLASMCTAERDLISYFWPTSGSSIPQCSTTRHFSTRGSLSLVLLLIQPSMEPLETCNRLPDTAKTSSFSPAGSRMSSSLSKASSLRRVTQEIATQRSPVRKSSIARAAAGVAAALEVELRRANLMPADSALEAMLSLEALEEVLALLIVSHWSLSTPLDGSDGAAVGALLLEELEKLMVRFSVAAASLAFVETLRRPTLFEVRLPSLPCRVSPCTGSAEVVMASLRASQGLGLELQT